jgi:hypothetical protein
VDYLLTGEFEGLFDDIVGKTLTTIYVDSSHHEFLKLECSDESSCIIYVEGDCCSESWWADIIGVKSALGGMIISWRVLEMPPMEYPEKGAGKGGAFTDRMRAMGKQKSRFIDGRRTRQDCDECYGFEITTTKGTITLAFRNSSNGYYGGRAYVWDKKCKVTSWTKIDSDDWTP